MKRHYGLQFMTLCCLICLCLFPAAAGYTEDAAENTGEAGTYTFRTDRGIMWYMRPDEVIGLTEAPGSCLQYSVADGYSGEEAAGIFRFTDIVDDQSIGSIEGIRIGESGPRSTQYYFNDKGLFYFAITADVTEEVYAQIRAALQNEYGDGRSISAEQAMQLYYDVLLADEAAASQFQTGTDIIIERTGQWSEREAPDGTRIISGAGSHSAGCTVMIYYVAPESAAAAPAQ